MKWCSTALAMSAALWPVAALAQAKPAVITQPDWLEKPTAEALAEAYPKLAMQLRVAGGATIDCQVNAEGRLTGCGAAAEWPKGLGFGPAAVSLAATFKMRPKMVDGHAVDGGQVRIPLRFTLPAPEDATPPPKPATDEDFRQARRLALAFGVAETVIDQNRKVARQPAIANAEGVLPSARDAAAQALGDAAVAHREDIVDAYARALASIYSAGEMAEIADYWSGPGRLIQNNRELQDGEGRVRIESGRLARMAAHEAFCAAHPCATSADLQRVWRPADPKDARLDNPQWVRIPGAARVSGVTPTFSALLNLTGVVRMTCRAAGDGSLNACEVDEELPARMGYGQAALQLSREYRLSEIQRSDAKGKKVTVRLGFPPIEIKPFDPPKAGSEAALAAARKAIVEAGMKEATRSEIELALVDLAERTPRGADAALYEAALDAYRQALGQALDATVENRARVWAAELDERQIAAFAAFRGSAGGRAQMERVSATSVALAKAGKYLDEIIAADAHAAYCKVEACERPAPQSSAGSGASAPDS